MQGTARPSLSGQTEAQDVLVWFRSGDAI